MAQSISTWSKRAKSECKRMSIEELSSVFFFRDPIRPVKNNFGFIYSPADGIILDCKEVASIDNDVFTKYRNISLNNLSYGQIDEGAYWVATIFLTFYDPHIIRSPVNGRISRIDLPAYFIENNTMLEIEKKLLDQQVAEIRQKLIASISFNQRVLFNIKPPHKNENLHLILTADYDIDTVISFFSDRNSIAKQNTRIASVRYGSMVTCVVPRSWRIKPTQKINSHVEAGIDTLFEFL